MAKTTKQTTRKATTTTSASKASKSKGVTKSRTTPMLELSEEQIRMRAFEVFQRRNGAPGTPDGDWLIAEQELRQELAGM